jgi:hypothetical protein
MLLQLALATLPQTPAAKPAAAPLFVDDTSALAGVTTTCGTRAKDYIIEVDGGGVALADFDGDGDLDLVVVDGSTLERVKQNQPGFPARLLLNDGSGHFQPASEKWALPPGRWGMGCAVGDVDGDGWLDLVVTNWGKPQLFHNLAGQGFSEIGADRSGFEGARWTSSAAFLDFDHDGCLDLALVNYLAFDPATIAPPGGGCTWKGHDVMCGPEGLVPVHDQLFRGSKESKFTDVTSSAGFRPPEAAFGLGVTTLDYDLDGDTDIYVSNDSTPNFLWENQGDGTFKEVGMLRGVSHDMNGKEQAGMGIACGDVNGDGREDLLVTNFSGENNAFYQSRGDKGFRERSAPAGLAGPSIPLLGWGTALQDFDLDGDLDVSVMNGHVYPQADEPGTDTSYAQPAQLYRNDGTGKFTVESLAGGPDRVMRASTCGDIDGDGDLDLVAIELDGPVHVFRNTTLPRKDGPHWLRVQLRSKSGNRFALGARVVAEWNGGVRASEVRTSGGFQASLPPEVHFGLGASAAPIKLSIRWPSRREQQLADVAVDRVLAVDEPER